LRRSVRSVGHPYPSLMTVIVIILMFRRSSRCRLWVNYLVLCERYQLLRRNMLYHRGQTSHRSIQQYHGGIDVHFELSQVQLYPDFHACLWAMVSSGTCLNRIFALGFSPSQKQQRQSPQGSGSVAVSENIARLTFNKGTTMLGIFRTMIVNIALHSTRPKIKVPALTTLEDDPAQTRRGQEGRRRSQGGR
jgi:hypothetical protein